MQFRASKCLSGILVCVACVSSSPSLAASKCSVSYGEEKRSVVTFANRKIEFIGWTHTLTGQKGLAAKRLSDALKFAHGGDCVSVERVLDSAIKSLPINLSEGHRVFNILVSINRDVQLRAICVEYSPSEIKIDELRAEESFEQAAEILKLCGQTREAVGNILKLFPGPERVFAKSLSPSLAVLPVESDNLKDESAAEIPPEVEAFDVETATITDAARKIMRKIAEALTEDLIGPSDEEIEQAVNAEVNSEMKELLRKVGVAAQKIAFLARERNRYIARKLSELDGNVAVVIGSAHIKGLAAEMASLCSQNY